MELSKALKTYTFKVIVEPDEDRWHAYCPVLEKYGAATWANTEEEAYQHIQEVVRMVVAELLEDGEKLPEGSDEVGVLPGVQVAVPISHAH